MSVKVQSIMLHVIAWTVLAGVISNVVLAQKNRAQAQLNLGQQQFVQSTLPLDSLNKEIVKALAELSAKNQDEQLRSLLAANGITFNVNPPAAAPANAQGSLPAGKK